MDTILLPAPLRYESIRPTPADERRWVERGSGIALAAWKP